MSEDNNQSNTPNISQISRKTLDYVDSGFGQHFLTKTNKNQYEFRKENTDT